MSSLTWFFGLTTALSLAVYVVLWWWVRTVEVVIVAPSPLARRRVDRSVLGLASSVDVDRTWDSLHQGELVYDRYRPLFVSWSVVAIVSVLSFLLAWVSGLWDLVVWLSAVAGF